MDFDLAKLRKAAEEIAREGGDRTLDFFKKSFDLEYKKDNSPVTDADREAETVIREAIRTQFPEHGIIGEEFGIEGEGRDIVWVIDPIDGTQSFIHGIPFYTTLIGILFKGIAKIGIVYAPALNEMLVASKGAGTYLNGKSCSVRPCDDLSMATFLTTDIEHIRTYNFEKPFEELLMKTRIHRTWGDAYGHLMVATGRADIMFDPILNLWDAAALLPVVTEAGGSFTDVSGSESIETGNAISCTMELRQHVLNMFSDN